MPYRSGISGADNTARDKEICELRSATGMSFVEIGKRYMPALSKETVRLIVRHDERRRNRVMSDSMRRLRDAFVSGGVTGRG